MVYAWLQYRQRPEVSPKEGDLGMQIRHVTSLWTSVGVSMETPPFTIAWCEYSSSETDGRIAS